jgi:septal ring factor EnvC (AmiA/AmiB activator)
MRIKKLLTIIFVSVITVLLITVFLSTETEAEVSCPEYMSNQECLDYLNDQLDDLQRSRSDISQNLAEEQYQQKTLEEKLSYISSQIAETERIVKTIQLEIETKNVEISILENDIKEKENQVSLMKQEISILEDIVNKRVIELYKYSFYNTFELFLDTDNLSGLLRKAKYMMSTREKDRDFLEEYHSDVEILREEEEILATNREDLQLKRAQIEEEEKELLTERANLEGQRAEKNALLAESERREKQYFAELQYINNEISSAENEATELLLRLYNTGQLKNGTHVKSGTIIGADGHTGCSFGTHLHFVIRKNNYYVNPLDYLNYSGGYVSSGTFRAPMTGAYMTQGYHSGHSAIDLVSLNSGYQGYERYEVPYGLCPIVDGILNSRKADGRSDWNLAYMRGEGAPVYAIADGTVYYYTDRYGGKYALLVHDDDTYKSLYVHLK